MKKQFVFLFVFILVCVGSCSRVLEQPEYPVVIETVDGVKTVTNPEYPAEGRFDLQVTEDFTVGEGKGDEPGVLNQPRDLKVDRSGTLFVLDAGDNNIKVYDDEGAYSHTIGRPGQGPGELGRFIYFDISPEGKVFVMDGMNRRISMFEKDGSFISDFGIEGFHDKIAVCTGDYVFLSRPVTTPEDVIGAEQVLEQVVTICQYDHEGNSKNTYGEYRGNLISYKRMSEGSVFSGSSPYGYQTVWDVCQGERLLQGYSENYQMTVHAVDGSPEFRFGRQFTQIKYPMFGRGRVNPEFYPAFDRIVVFDDDRNIWLMQYGIIEPEEGRIYDIFSPDGIYLKQVYVPDRIYAVCNGKLYSIERTEDEFIVARRYSYKEQVKQ